MQIIAHFGWKNVFIILHLFSYAVFCSANLNESEEQLRKNIAKLTRGELDFNEENISYYEDELSDYTPENSSEYDFIVIGAGSAGSTIASRLSEAKSTTVLLIEAGAKEYPIMDIPLMAIALQLSDQINWKYQTHSSDKFCLSLKDFKCVWPRGKVMGGTSVLNFMLATRGNKKDFDGWAKMTGDESWSYKSMLEYFKKLENFEVSNVDVDWGVHNKVGPMHISSPTYSSQLAKDFLAAGQEKGYQLADYNGREQYGFSLFQSTIKNGERWSSNRGYLHMAKNRKNLFLTRNSFVTRIVIDKKSKSTIGVQFVKNNETIFVKVNKEVILSAGAINSPQILMLSGIGPAKHLSQLNIEALIDAPVGKNLMDHLSYGGLIFKVNDSNTFHDLNLLDPKNPEIKNYLTKRNGSLAGVGYEALGYVNVDSNNLNDVNPNIELLFGPTSGLKDPQFAKVLGIRKEYQDIMNKDVFNHSAYTIWAMMMHPKSRGKILLQSNNPFEKPKLYANYLSDPRDIKVMIKGIRFAINLTKTEALQKHGSELYQVPLPCEAYEYDSDSYWECAIRTYTTPVWHPSGTCRMGKEDDKSSVVNSRLQVIGIKNLRVADASVMPKIVSAHPNIPIIAIGEKIADIIKADWNLSPYIEKSRCPRYDLQSNFDSATQQWIATYFVKRK